MKKDILIPKVEQVYIAIAYEYNQIYKTHDWNAYIINNKEVDLEMVIIVTTGYSDDKKTATFRKQIDIHPQKSYAKIEWIENQLRSINNSFKVSFFEGNKMFDKTYIFRKNTINIKALQPIPLMNLKGVLVK